MKNLRKQRGGVAAFAILSMTLLLTVGVGVAGLTVQSMKRARRDVRAATAFQAAQAGLDYQLAKEFASLESRNGGFVNYEGSSTSDLTPLAPGCTGTVNSFSPFSWNVTVQRLKSIRFIGI